MSDSIQSPLPGQHDAAMVQAVLDELAAVPAVDPQSKPPRSITVARNSLLHAWLDLYWAALDRAEFLEWASACQLDVDTFQLKGDSLLASRLKDGVQVTQAFTLEDASGWWKFAPTIQSIAQRIDPAGLGLPYIGGKSRNFLHTCSRRVVLAFYGYPEPENRSQALVISEELRTKGFAVIGDSGYTTSALVQERAAQLEDFTTLAAELEKVVNASIYEKRSYDPVTAGRRRLALSSDSLLATMLDAAAAALKALIADSRFLTLARQTSPFTTCAYSAPDQAFSFTLPDGSIIEHPQQQFIEGLSQGQLEPLTLAAEKAGTPVADDGQLRIDQLLACYGFTIPATAADALALTAKLRGHAWADLPFVSEFVQSSEPIGRYTLDFGAIEDYRHISRRLAALSWNKEANERIALDEFSEPDSKSPLGVQVQKGQQALLQFRSSPAFQTLLKSKGLPVDSRILLTSGGHVGAPGHHKTWAELTADVEANPVLKAERERLKPLAVLAGGSLRTNGQVSLVQMLGFYKMSIPAKAVEARVSSAWLQPMQVMRPGFMDHWYLLGKPGELDRLTDQRRKDVIDTTRDYLADTTLPLIDFLSENVVPELSSKVLRAKADYLISQLLASPRAHQLGNRLLRKLFPVGWKTQSLRAINRDRLVLSALLLSLDPNAGLHANEVIDQRLDDSFFWGEPYSEVRRYIEGQFALQTVKHKALAAHLLLSGIAPEFLVRDIPDSLPYISSYTWVKLKQVVLYLEKILPGMTRMMTFGELMKLSELPLVTVQWTLHEQPIPKMLPVNWAIARGLVEQNSNGPPVSGDDVNRTKKAATAFDSHYRRLGAEVASAFFEPFPTPYTVALADLRKVFPGNQHLESKLFVSRPVDSLQADEQSMRTYSLVELHMAHALKSDSASWQSTSDTLKFADLVTSYSRLISVTDAFAQALEKRLDSIKTALIALIKEQFCQLPLMQRLDLKWSRFELFTLNAVTSAVAVADPVENSDLPGAPFAIIVSCFGSFPRLYEVFARQATVTLRRDVDHSVLVPSPAVSVPRQLPFDGEAYLNGAAPRKQVHCRAVVKSLETLGTPLPEDPHQPVPATFTSSKINAIAHTAVQQLMDGYAAAAIGRARLAIDLDDVDQNHGTWLDFYRNLVPSTIEVYR